MKRSRNRTAVRLKEVRDRVDAFEAQESVGSAPAAPNRTVAIVFWVCLILIGLAIYFFTAWSQRH